MQNLTHHRFLELTAFYKTISRIRVIQKHRSKYTIKYNIVYNEDILRPQSKFHNNSLELESFLDLI